MGSALQTEPSPRVGWAGGGGREPGPFLLGETVARNLCLLQIPGSEGLRLNNGWVKTCRVLTPPVLLFSLTKCLRQSSLRKRLFVCILPKSWRQESEVAYLTAAGQDVRKQRGR